MGGHLLFSVVAGGRQSDKGLAEDRIENSASHDHAELRNSSKELFFVQTGVKLRRRPPPAHEQRTAPHCQRSPGGP